jgi:pimeloyl-ACP methyl ester carboxylesterase
MLIITLLLIAYFFKSDISVEILQKKYATTHSHFLPFMGMQVHYRDEGNSADTLPIVLLHGTSSSLLTWDSVTHALIANHRVIRFDLPGYGLTGPNPNGVYDFTYYNQFVDSFLITLGVKHCILTGNSLGGGIAWHYALAHPEKIDRLILVDASGFPNKQATKGALGFKLAQIPVLNKLLTYITPKVLVRKSLEDVYGDKKKVTDELVEQYFSLLLRTGNRKALIDRMRMGFGTNEAEKIKLIKVPTLIVWGETDQLIPVDDAQLFQQAIAKSKLVIFNGVGHVPMEEVPDKFVAAVNLFLREQ